MVAFNQISEAQEEVSAFAENVSAVVQQLGDVSLPHEEEKKQEIVEVSSLAEPEPVNDSGKTFGYDNQFLIENDIDPAILAELPEEMRVELLSTLPQPP